MYESELTPLEINEILVNWIDYDHAPFQHETEAGLADIDRDGRVWIDGEHVFGLAEHLRHLVVSSTVEAACRECGWEHTVEPDAQNYDCRACDAEGAVTSPLVQIGYA